MPDGSPANTPLTVGEKVRDELSGETVTILRLLPAGVDRVRAAGAAIRRADGREQVRAIYLLRREN